MNINHFYRFVIVSAIAGSLQSMDTSPDTKAAASQLLALSQSPTPQSSLPMDTGHANGNSNSNVPGSQGSPIDLFEDQNKPNGIQSNGNGNNANQSSSSSNNANGSSNSHQPIKKRKLSIVSANEDRIVLRNQADQDGAAAPKRQRLQAPGRQAPENAYLDAKLLDAIKAGSVKDVESLIAQGAPVNFIARSYFLKNENLVIDRTCLDYAVKYGNLAIIKKLLEAKADPNVQCVNALASATHCGRLDAMAMLLKAGAYGNSVCTTCNLTPLMTAQTTNRSKNPLVAEAQIALLTNKHTKNMRIQTNSQNQAKDADLKIVANNNENNVLALRPGICTPLFQAIDEESPSKVDQILQQNARYLMDLANCTHGWKSRDNSLFAVSPLAKAAIDGNPKIIQLLLDAKACPNAMCMAPLGSAIAQGSLDMVFALLQHGAAVNITWVNGETPFSAASKIANPVLRDAMIALINTHTKKDDEKKKAEEGKA